MKTVLLVLDSLQSGFIEPYYPDGFIFRNHWALHGYTGPSFLNMMLSTTKTDYPTHLKHRDKSIVWARSYPLNAKSVCKEFKDSCFITQHPMLSRQEGYDQVASHFSYMAFEFKERKTRLEDCRLGSLVDVGVRFLNTSESDVMVLLWSIETHSRGCNIYFPDSKDPLRDSIEYSVNAVQPLIDASDLFIITSDHGGIRNPSTGKIWHPLTSTRKEHPSQFKVPLIVLGAGQGECLRETNHLDLAPLILYLNGKNIPENYEGKLDVDAIKHLSK